MSVLSRDLSVYREQAISQVELDLGYLLRSAAASKRIAATKALDALSSGAVYRDDCGWVAVKSSSGDQVYYIADTICSCPSRRACWHLVAKRALELYEAYLEKLAQDDTAPKPPSVRQDQRRLGDVCAKHQRGNAVAALLTLH